MKTAFYSRLRLCRVAPATCFSALPLATLLVLAASHALAATTGTIRYSGTDFEGRRAFQIEWPAVSNATYIVQSATDLSAANPWQTIDAVTPENSSGVLEIKGRSIPENSVEFFRLVLPQPQIFTVEPAVVAPGVAVDFHIIGQCFPTNAELRINSLPQAGVLYQSSSALVKPSFTPSTPGNYQFEIVVSDQVVSSFNVVCADALANPELVLQGPPELPPASPQALLAIWASRKGYQYYKAQSDLAASGLNNNPYFVGNNNQGNMPDSHRRTGGVREDCDDGNDDFSPVNGVAIPKFVDVTKAAQIAAAKADMGRTWSGGPGINPATGETKCEAVDLVIPGRSLDFVWARTYNSRIGRGSSPNGWTFSYDISIQPLGGDILIHDGTGRADTFKLQTNGVYTCPEFFREGTLSNNVFTLTFADGGTWEFNALNATTAAGKLARIKTKNPGSTGYKLSYDVAGRLAQIVDDLDRTNTVAYDTAGRLASVTDFSGRTVSYAYYGLGETGGNPGDLKSVTSPPVTGTPNGNDFPDGKTTTYTYSTGFTDDRENHLLLAVFDAAGQKVCDHVYQHNQTDLEFLRCVAAQEGTNPPTQFRFFPRLPTHINGYAVGSCIVNDPEGNVTEYFYDARNRCVLQREFTGRATPGVPVTDTVNRPAGKLRSSDPDSFETQWAWNNDSLCTSLVLDSHQIQCRYESDFNPATPPRKRADCRVVRELAGSPVDLDGDGVAETTERIWHYEYDPRFGSDSPVIPDCNKYQAKARRTEAKISLSAAWLGKKLYVGNLPYAETGLPDAAIVPTVSSHAINTKGMGANTGMVVSGGGKLKSCLYNIGMLGFVTTATDPRGGVTTAGYDSSGNQLFRMRKRPEILYQAWDNELSEYIAYNSHGQPVAVTNAPDANGYRRVDTISYYETGPQAGGVQSITIDEPGMHLTSSFEYDTRGNLTRCVDPRGNDSLFTYNALDQLVRRRGAVYIYAGGSPRIASNFAYDVDDNLIEVSTELRDADGVLTGSKTDRFQYDSLHRPTEIALAVDASHALTNRFLYDGNGQCVQALGGDAVSGADPHQAVVSQYDERGLLFREIAAPGSPDQNTTQCDYDANGNLTRLSEGLEGTPSVTTLEYDGFVSLGVGVKAVGQTFTPPSAVSKKMMGAPKIGEATAVFKVSPAWVEAVWNKQCVEKDFARPSRITDPMGNVTTFNYDANDNLKVVRHYGELNDVPGSAGNIRLAETRCDYDGLDRLRKVHALHFGELTQTPIGDGEATTTFDYAPNGACSSVMDDNHHTTRFRYDTAGRPSGVARGILESGPFEEGVQQCAFSCDAAGNVTNIVQTDIPGLGGAPQVFSITNVFDPLNRCISTTDNVGNNENWQFDSLNRVTAQFNPKEYKRTFAYDLLGRCTLAVADFDGDGVLDLAHDYSERATWSSSNGRLLSTTDSHTNTTTYAYDSLGRCTNVTRADGTQQKLVWSPRSNLIREEDPNGNVITNIYDLNSRIIHRDIAARFETFAYDGCGRLVSHANNDASGGADYDSLGNCVSETLNGLTTSSTYDALGNRLSLTYPGGRVLAYAYDVNNNCTSISESGAVLASFSYDGASRMSRITYGNGTRAGIAYDGFVSPPNAVGDYGFGQIRRMRHEVAASSAVIEDRTFSYDRAQNKTIRDMTAPFAPGSVAQAQAFQYDAVDRLIASLTTTNGALAGLVAYGLDRMGNRINVTGDACSGAYALDATSPSPLDFQMNQYTATPCEAFNYDDNGNLVARGSAAAAMAYQYDYAGRVVLVQALDAGTGSFAPLASYTYDALGRRVSKTVYSGGATITRNHCYDGSCAIETRESGAIIDSLLNLPDDRYLLGLRHYGQDYFLHTDDQGNTLALTDAKGAVVERYDYDDYGTVTFLDPNGALLLGSDGMPATSSAVGNAFLFHGMEWDADTGLYSKLGGVKNNPLYEDKGTAGENPFYDSKTGREVSGNVSHGEPTMDGNDVNRDRTLNGSNPWSLKKEEGGRHTPFHNRTTLKNCFQTHKYCLP